MPVRSDVDLANLTDIGCQREQNEDFYGYFEPENDDAFRAKGRLLAIADGMGGHRGGQMASGIAIDSLRNTFLNSPLADPQSLLIEAFGRAQHAILAAAQENPDLAGMGTTCTAAIIQGDRLTYGHIGDSRLYLLREDALQQLTEDHSYVNQLVRSGALTPEQAATHEKRNVLTAALGMDSQKVTADFSPESLALSPGDAVVLTSDGLHGLVTAQEITNAVSHLTPYEACRVLVDLAKHRDGPDNITVQILRLRPAAQQPAHTPLSAEKVF